MWRVKLCMSSKHVYTGRCVRELESHVIKSVESNPRGKKEAGGVRRRPAPPPLEKKAFHRIPEHKSVRLKYTQIQCKDTHIHMHTHVRIHTWIYMGTNPKHSPKGEAGDNMNERLGRGTLVNHFYTRYVSLHNVESTH